VVPVAAVVAVVPVAAVVAVVPVVVAAVAGGRHEKI